MPERKTLNEDLFYRGSSANLPRLHMCENKVPLWDFNQFAFTKVNPGCAEECSDSLVQSGGRWQTLGVAAGLGAGPQVQRDLGLASEGVLRLWTLLSKSLLLPDLNPLDSFVWSYDENITNMTTHNTQASLNATNCRIFTALPPALVGKACSQFLIRIETVTEAEDGYIE